MVQRNYNPFTNIGLVAPVAHNDYYDQYCQTQRTGKTNVKRTPFRRKVDLWFTALSFAARKGLEPKKLKKKETIQFVTGGEIFNGDDSWRIQVLMLIAIAVDDNVEVVMDPRRMMDIANGLAAAGVPQIVKMLNEGSQSPICNLSDALDDLFRSDLESPDSSTRLVNTLEEALQMKRYNY